MERLFNCIIRLGHLARTAIGGEAKVVGQHQIDALAPGFTEAGMRT